MPSNQAQRRNVPDVVHQWKVVQQNGSRQHSKRDKKQAFDEVVHCMLARMINRIGTDNQKEIIPSKEVMVAVFGKLFVKKEK